MSIVSGYIFISETSGVATKVLAIISIVLPLLCIMKHVANVFIDSFRKH